MSPVNNIAIALGRKQSYKGSISFAATPKPVVPWQTEINKAGDRYHAIGAWVAVVFNLIFSINDFFVVPDEWLRFFIFRAGVSTATFIALMLWRRFRFSSSYMIFVPYALICIENAYIWSYMDVANFRTHTLAYIAIYIGASMLIIWPYIFSIAVVIVSILANMVFLSVNSRLTLGEIMTNGGILVGSVSIFSVLLLHTRYRLTKKEIIARLKLAESNEILKEQKVIIEENHRNITDSIRYAEKIQHSILPDPDRIRRYLPNSFVLFKPKDIVSGDFYWFAKKGDQLVIAAVDCTGHGVPGALMSMLGNSLLSKIVNDLNVLLPSEILDRLREGVIRSLKKNGTDSANGGMDMALCTIDQSKQTLQYAGAFNPLLIVRNGETIKIEADRMPIGRYESKTEVPFTNHEIDIREGDWYYIFSDGFQDQFGGPKDRKFGNRSFRSLLATIHSLPPLQQKKALEEAFDKWAYRTDQIDDIVIVGFQV